MGQMNPNGTAMLRVGSILERRQFVKKGLLQEASKSFWAPYKGNNSNAVIMYVNDKSKTEGNQVVFDMRGCLETSAIRGDTTAEGKGVQKQKFSDQVNIDSWRFVVDNGTKFRAKQIGDMKLSEHSDSVSLLADQWIRTSDQGIFDMLQQAGEYGYVFDGKAGNEFGMKALAKIELGVKTGFGYDVFPAKFGRRTKLKSFRTSNGEPLYVMFVDAFTKKLFLEDPETEKILASTDVRGNQNRLISGVIGRIGNFLIVEAPVFTGYNVAEKGPMLLGGKSGYYNFSSTAVLEQGMRTFIKENGKEIWQGTKEYDAKIAQVGQNGQAAELWSRCVVAGASALQFAIGMDPDYHFKTYDFDKFSESALEVWCGLKASRLHAENTDYVSHSVAGYNYGIVYVDVKIS